MKPGRFQRLNPTALFWVMSLLSATALLLMTVYVGVRLVSILGGGYSVADRIVAILLFASELFLFFHGAGYLSSAIKALRQKAIVPPRLFAALTDTPVAVLVCGYNEPEEILDETLAAVAAMDYSAAHVYLVDDSTDEECIEGARRLAKLYDVKLVQRTNRDGYKAGAINDLVPHLSEPLIAVLDADQRPIPSWLKEVVPVLEGNPKLAFVQAPQKYVNTINCPVAEAAQFQQAVFYEYICEGKSYSNAMFWCGSNVVVRRDALLSVEQVVDGRRQFCDETSVTEDFATTVRLQLKGWDTAYVNKAYVLGMGPETLPAYYIQQMRWAMGTFGVGLRLMRELVRNPRGLTAGQWWEYLLSGTYYAVGFSNLIFMLAPILFIFFGVTPFHLSPGLYFAIFIPYLAFTMNLFFFGMRLRGYRAGGVWLASALGFAAFWTHIKAGLVALLGLKRAFGVTPKGVGGAIPIRRMKPEFAMFMINVAAVATGIQHLVFQEVDLAYALNTVWAGYHVVLLSTLFFHFNQPVTIPERKFLFEPARAAA